MSVAGLILAGGRGSRMGASAPKPLLKLGERTLLGHVLDSFTPDFDPILISANDGEAFASFGLPVIADRLGGFQGPLAGLDAAGAYLADHRPEVSHLLALPGDTPFLPPDLGRRMLEDAGDVVRVARHRGRLQPTVALWTRAALARIGAALAKGESRSIVNFLAEVGFQAVDFPDETGAPGGDRFFNVNTEADLETALRFLAGR